MKMNLKTILHVHEFQPVVCENLNSWWLYMIRDTSNVWTHQSVSALHDVRALCVHLLLHSHGYHMIYIDNLVVAFDRSYHYVTLVCTACQ